MENQYIYLDIGDTVLHLKSPPGEIYLDLIHSFGISIGQIESTFANQTFYQGWSYMDQKYKRSNHQDRYLFHPEGSFGFWMELIEFFLNKFGLFEKPNLKKYIFESFESGEHWIIEPSFYDLVKLSQEKKIPMGVLSNWDNRLRHLLRKKDIHDFFEIFIISGEVGYEKPSSFIFDTAEKGILVSPASILYVGDKFSLDWLPAYKRGWNAFLFHPEWKSGRLDNSEKGSLVLPKECDIIGKLDTILGNHMNSIDAKAP